MLDSTPSLTAFVVPFQSPSPACPYRFHAFISDGSSPLTGAGETEIDAVIDLIEALIDTDQPALCVLAAIEAVSVPAQAAELIDHLGAIVDGDAFIPAAINHLETLDPLAAAERRKWF